MIVLGLALCVLAQANASSPPDRFVPSVGVSVGAYSESLRVGALEESRGLLYSGLQLGLHYRLFDGALEFATIAGHTRVEVAAVFSRGHVPLRLTQSLRLQRRLGWLEVFAGLGMGLSLNASQPSFSYLSLGLPLGFRVGPVDLVYLPSLTLGLASQQSSTFSGARTHRIARTIAPFMIELHYRFDGLRF